MIDEAAAVPSWWQRWARWWLNRLWYVHPGAALVVRLPPALCIRVLGTTAKPSMGRLEFRNLFAGGRRYHLHHTRSGGFAITTTSSVPWRYRARTSSSAVILGDFVPLEGTITRIVLRGHILPLYLASSLVLPTFFTSMVLFTPWHAAWKLLIGVALFGLSWMAHRFNAALDAYHMVYFVTKALEAYSPEPPGALAAGGGQVVVEAPPMRAFDEAWDRFYAAHRDETPHK